MPWHWSPSPFSASRSGRKSYKKRKGGKRRTSKWPKITSAGWASKNPAQQIHFHNRHCNIMAFDLTEINNLTIGQNFIGGLGARAFSLQDLANYTEYLDMYDFYKFGFVELTFTITNAPVAPDLDEESIIGQWTLHIDTDQHDTIMPSADTFLERGTVKQYQFDASKGNVVKVKLRPNVLRPVYNGILSSAYEPAGQPWISGVYPAVPHYGIKFMVRAPFNSTAATPTIDAPPLVHVEATYYLAFKKTK